MRELQPPRDFANALPGRTLVFVDSEATGHHITLYGSLILREAVAQGWSAIWLTSPSAAEAPAAVALLSSLGANLKIELAPFPSMPADTGHGAWAWYEVRHYFVLKKALRRLQKREAVSAVYLAWIDHFPRMLGAFGPPVRSLNYCGMHMHPPDCTEHSRLRGGWRERLRRITVDLNNRIYRWPQIHRVAMLMSEPIEALRSRKILGGEKLVEVPEVAIPPGPGSVSRTHSRAAIQAALDDCVLLVYGALSPVKGIPQLLDACLLLPIPQRWIIVLAGSQRPEIHSLIQDRKSELESTGLRFVIQDKFLSDEEQNAAFIAADIVWMGYTGTLGSSGVLFLAGAFGLPILATEEGFIGSTARRHDLGPVVPVYDAPKVALELEYLRRDASTRLRHGSRGQELASLHRPEHFSRKILEIIEETAQRSQRPR